MRPKTNCLRVAGRSQAVETLGGRFAYIRIFGVFEIAFFKFSSPTNFNPTKAFSIGIEWLRLSQELEAAGWSLHQRILVGGCIALS
jgi:hypothetical protein